MYRRLLTAASTAALSLALAAGVASAQVTPPGDPVGTPGEPDCHGVKVSNGNRTVVNEPFLGLEDYRLTPPNRVALLELFEGGDFTVQDYHDRVRERCAAPGNAVAAHEEISDEEIFNDE